MTHADIDLAISLLRATLDATTDGILVVDRVGQMVIYNARFAEIWHLPPELLRLGHDADALDFILPQLEEPERFLAKVNALYRRPALCSEDELTFRDGRVVERYSQPQWIGAEIVGRVWRFRDITERAHAVADRDRLLAEKERALRDAEAAQQRWAMLAEASRVLADSLDDAATLNTVARSVVPAFADACGIFVVDEDRAVRELAAAHRHPAMERQLTELFERFPPSVAARQGLGQVVATGKTVRVAEVDDAFFRGIASSPEHLKAVRQSGLRSYLAVPMSTGRVVRGAMLFGMTEPGRRFGERDVPFAEELGRRCAAAVEHARLFRTMQAAVRRSDESLALVDALFRVAPIGICLLSPELRYLRINEAFSGMHGARPEDELGKTPQEVVPHLAHLAMPRLRQVLETGEALPPMDLDEPDRRDSGKVRHWRLNHFPVRTAEGRMVGVGVTALDETERRARAEQLARHLSEAEKAIRERDEFLSLASHELKTPLTAAVLRLQIFLRSAPLSSVPHAEQLTLLAQQLDRLAHLVDELLDVSRMRVGRLQLRREPVELVGLVQEQLDALEPTMRRTGSTVALDAGGPVRGEWDRGRLEQIVDNLVSNAFKFGGGGVVEVGVRRHGDRAVLTVRDHGPGIPAADQARVFERFERVSPSSGATGLGLGLYVVQQLAQAHGGTAAVQSLPGEGATFTVELPCQAE